jgi:hypothetical protein
MRRDTTGSSLSSNQRLTTSPRTGEVGLTMAIDGISKTIIDKRYRIDLTNCTTKPTSPTILPKSSDDDSVSNKFLFLPIDDIDDDEDVTMPILNGYKIPPFPSFEEEDTQHPVL